MKSAASVFLLVFVLMTAPAPAAQFAVGSRLPPLSGETLDGETFSFAELKGKPILMMVGTTWCPACKKQKQALAELESFITSNDIVYVDVYLKESAQKIRTYLDKYGFQRADRIILDQGKIGRALRVRSIPRLIMIDRDLTVRRDGVTLLGAELRNKLVELVE